MSGLLNPLPAVGRLMRLPRLPRRILVLAALLAVILYVSFKPAARAVAQPLYSLAWRSPGRADPHPADVLEPQPDGTVLVQRTRAGATVGHPIRELMRQGRDEWDALLARQSTTFAQAVATYRRRYGRAPPKGFDAWWAFVKQHEVKIVDDYDEIFESIAPFFALRPDEIAKRLHQVLYDEPFSYRMAIKRSAPVTIAGDRGSAPRPKLLAELVEGFRHALPLDFGEGAGVLGEGLSRGNDGVVIWGGSDHDLGGHIMGQEFRERMMELAGDGQFIDEDELAFFENRNRRGSLPGTMNACRKDSIGSKKAQGENDIILEPLDDVSRPRSKPIRFLKDVVRSYDFCHNPALLPLHGTFSFDFPRDTSLLPQLVLSKYAQGNQLLTTPLEGFSNETKRTHWAEKTIDKVFWRGSSTGDSYSVREDGYDWRQSHRIRLHTLANANEGRADVLVETPTRGGGHELRLQRYDLADLNRRLMDVGLSAITQCSEADGTCAAMRAEIHLAGMVDQKDAVHYKAVLDLDGNGWSARFRRLLGSSSLVFKSTIFPEWNTQWLKPWVHYVPINVDLSDLYHVSIFYLGTPDGVGGHDDLAREIAEAAARFTDEHWRWVDMQAYMFRLLLEYRRAMSTDRNAMSLDGHMW